MVTPRTREGVSDGVCRIVKWGAPVIISPVFVHSQLTEHFARLGHVVRPLGDDEPRPKQRFFSRVWAWIGLVDCPIDLVGVSPSGTLPLSADNWSFSIGRRVKVPMRQVHPVQYHFVVRRNPMPFPPHFKAELGKRRQWKGGVLARRLAEDEELSTLLEDALAKHERLDVIPEPEEKLVRIRLKTRSVFGLLTMIPDGMKAETGLPSAELFGALCRIARHVREAKLG